MVTLCINSSFFFLLSLSSLVLFDFSKNCDLSTWKVVDDVVMGGRSAGQLNLTEEGHALFSGQVSLENYGGFSSIRHSFLQKKIDRYSRIILHLKGDGKPYQLRVKSNSYDRFSYVTLFETTGDWDEIIIPLDTLEPRFRGRILDMPNYPAETIAELGILVGNKKAESFVLEIDKIILD